VTDVAYNEKRYHHHHFVNVTCMEKSHIKLWHFYWHFNSNERLLASRIFFSITFCMNLISGFLPKLFIAGIS
jgi:hypothetical protein